MGSSISSRHWYQCVPAVYGPVESDTLCAVPSKSTSNQAAMPCRMAVRTTVKASGTEKLLSDAGVSNAKSMRWRAVVGLRSTDGGKYPTTGCEKWSMRACCLSGERSRPQKSCVSQNASFWSCSSQMAWSEKGEKNIVPVVGNILPAGLRNRSRAAMKLSSMRSCTSRKPIGSEMITSAFSGSSTSSTFPLMTSTLSASPLASISFRAWDATPDASMAYTLRAPALAAKKARIPLPVPTSTTTLPRKSAGLEMNALWYVPVRTASWSMFCWCTSCP
mmetsp:Transcript_16057/g.60734  ORF Transcript_16057/g.60734 Transcript_16057/m.60734 type:complete len:276 (+) Transcript_16057:291-1118(+)